MRGRGRGWREGGGRGGGGGRRHLEEEFDQVTGVMRQQNLNPLDTSQGKRKCNRYCKTDSNKVICPLGSK